MYRTGDAVAMPAQTLRVLKLREYETGHAHRNVSGEIEMVKDFARSEGLRLVWVEVFRSTELFDRLIAGDGDMIVGTLPPGIAHNPAIVATESVGTERYRVVGRPDSNAENPLDLAGLRAGVRWSSPLWPYLERLKQRLPSFRLQALPSNLAQDEVLRLVADGVYDVTILPTGGADGTLSDPARLKFLFDLTDVEPVAWHVRAGDHALETAANDFIRRFQAAYVEPVPRHGDFDAIKARGVLRIVTRPDAQNYFIENGRPRGFEYELVQEFAQRHGLRVEVLVGRDTAQMLEWLKRGIGDIITTRIDADLLHGQRGFAVSRAYRYSAPTVISSTGTKYTSPAQLSGQRVAIYPNTHYDKLLERMNNAGDAIEIIPAKAGEALETFVDRILKGQVDAAVVDGDIVDDLMQIQPRLTANSSLDQQFFDRWTVRTEDQELLAMVNEFVRHEYKSETYNVLNRRYFGTPRHTNPDDLEYISPFDPLVRLYADQYGFDWRLITAQMFQESGFDPTVISSTGAAGLMQVMPGTARALGFSDIADPEAGIHAGIKYLYQLRDRFDKQIPMRERTWFALAAYNVGFYRIERAREAAKAFNLDPNKWFGNVETAIRRLARDQGATALACHCAQTIAYVSSIRSLYSTYRRLQTPFETSDASRLPSAPPV